MYMLTLEQVSFQASVLVWLIQKKVQKDIHVHLLSPPLMDGNVFCSLSCPDLCVCLNVATCITSYPLQVLGIILSVIIIVIEQYLHWLAA